MATEIATAYVSIIPSTKGLASKISREFGQVETAADKAGKNAGKRMSSGISSSLKGIGKLAAGALAAVGTIGVGAVLGDAVKQAGDLEQSVGAINAVFKGQAGQMMGWAKEASTAVGLSRNEYQELATTLGALLKNGGTPLEELGDKTNDLVGLGADLASMFGGTTKDAVGALSSALKGERDPIEAYGVSLNQAKIDAEAAALGFEKVDGALSAEATQAATLSLIMKQTTDAHGNFAAEADTFAGKQQRMGAQWDDLKAKIGEQFLPILSTAMGFVTDTAMPALDTFIGGLSAFREAWKANNDDVTSSGFAGFMEQFANKLRDIQEFLTPIGDWLRENKDIWGPFAIGVGAVAAAFGAWSVMAWAVGGAIAFITSPITITIAAIGLLVGALVYAYNNFDWFRNAVDAVWAWIKNAAAVVVAWFVGTALPWIQNALKVMGDAFAWLYNNIIKPVWDAIRIAIAVAVGTIMAIFDGIMWVVRNILGPVFTWLYTNIIQPVFTWIQDKIGAFSVWFDRTRMAVQMRLHVLGRTFGELYDRYVRPVWDWIRDKISAGWNFLRDKVFNPLISVVRDKVGPAFNAAKDAVKRAWDKIQDIVKKPVKFVIDTVINGALIKNINKVLGSFGMKKLDTVSSGFRKGGYTGNVGKDDVAGVVHGREHVIRAESTAAINKTNPGLLDAMNKYGASALGIMAPGDRVYGGAQSFYGRNIDAVSRSGVLNVAGSAPGWDLDGAIRMADAATRIKVRRGPASGSNSVYVQTVQRPLSAYAGKYFEDGGILLNNSLTGAHQRRVVAAHELGHALGLPHSALMHGGNGARSIMNYDNMFQVGGFTDADVAALARIHGGGGKAGEAGGSWVDNLVDKLGGTITDIVVSPVTKLIDSISGRFDGIAGDIAVGAAKFLLDKGKDWVGKKVDGVWDAPVGTTHALKPGVSSIYNGTGSTEFFQRVTPGSGGVVELSAADRALLREIAEAVDIELEGEHLISGIRRAKAKTRDRSPL